MGDDPSRTTGRQADAGRLPAVTEQARAIDEMNPDGVPRKVLFVAGAGRSGTSTLAGIGRKLGMHVPLPEVPPDDSNPRGFSEPQWVVDVHDEWLARGAGAGQRLAARARGSRPAASAAASPPGSGSASGSSRTSPSTPSWSSRTRG